MAVKIPFTSDAWQTFSCTLNGVEYGFAANYNDRSGVWSFTMSLKSSEQVLVAGVPILLGCDLLAPFGLGIGSMFAVDLTASPVNVLAPDGATVIPATEMIDADPVGAFNDDMGARVIVIYLASGEGVATP
jgi:hypothetical protein